MEHVMEMMEMGFGGEMQRKILHETKEVSKPVRRGFVSTLILCSFSCRKMEFQWALGNQNTSSHFLDHKCTNI